MSEVEEQDTMLDELRSIESSIRISDMVLHATGPDEDITIERTAPAKHVEVSIDGTEYRHHTY